jgi:hypothetical protein
MENGAFFFLAFLGMFVGTIGLGLYVYVAYRIGMRLGARAGLNRPMWLGILFIALVCQPFSFWPYLTDWHAFMKLGIAMAFFLLNAYPTAIGYGAAVEMSKEQSKRRFRKNVDDWLGEWECEPAHHFSDEEERGGG